jgi:hypothetical protein
MSYHAQFDILRYETRGPMPRILDIGLEYDAGSRLLRIDTTRTWRWRETHVPLNMASESALVLTEIERQDVIQKLCIFQSKHPKKYQSLAGC